MTWISEEQAEKALHWLVENAKGLGEAKRAAVLAESMTKRIKALEMTRSDAKTIAEKERDAIASDAYLKAITAEAEAAGAYETMRALKDAAGARIDAWRTIRATERAMTK